MGRRTDWGVLRTAKLQTKLNFFLNFCIHFQRGKRIFLKEFQDFNLFRIYFLFLFYFIFYFFSSEFGVYTRQKWRENAKIRRSWFLKIFAKSRFWGSILLIKTIETCFDHNSSKSRNFSAIRLSPNRSRETVTVGKFLFRP